VFFEAIVVDQVLLCLVIVSEEWCEIVWITRVVNVIEEVQEVFELSFDVFLLLIGEQIYVPIQGNIRFEAIDCSLLRAFTSCLVDSLLKNCAFKGLLV
jgi:hypothetical protein